MVLAVLAEYEKLFGEHKAMVENYEKIRSMPAKSRRHS